MTYSKYDINKNLIEFSKVLQSNDLKFIELFIEKKGHFLEKVDSKNGLYPNLTYIISKQNDLEVLDVIFNSKLQQILLNRHSLIECLFSASKNGNMNTIKYVVEKFKENVEPITKKEITKCYINSCTQKNIEVINYFLKSKEHPEYKEIEKLFDNKILHKELSESLIEKENISKKYKL